eukprot:Skav233588  [mRNA]  locus=scaffold2520:316252:326315:- [translate_table: standard]
MVSLWYPKALHGGWCPTRARISSEAMRDRLSIDALGFVLQATLSGAFRDTAAVLRLVLLGAGINAVLTPVAVVMLHGGTAGVEPHGALLGGAGVQLLQQGSIPGAAWATTFACYASAVAAWLMVSRRPGGPWLPRLGQLASAALVRDASVTAAFESLVPPAMVMLLIYGPLVAAGAMWVSDGVLYGFGEYVWVAKCTSCAAASAGIIMLLFSTLMKPTAPHVWWSLNVMMAIRAVFGVHRVFFSKKSPLSKASLAKSSSTLVQSDKA